jgi:multidrug efflux pump subunit AcrB
MLLLQDGYASLARRVIAHPGPLGLALVALVVLGASGLRGLPTGFLPEMDEGGFVLDYALPVGSSLVETDAACRRIEAILLATPEVGPSCGAPAPSSASSPRSSSPETCSSAQPRADRERDVFEVVDDAAHAAGARGAQAPEVEFIQVMQDTIADLAGNPSPIEVKLFGRLRRAPERGGRRGTRSTRSLGIVDVKNHVSFGSPELSWRPDPRRAARAGLTTDGIAAQTRSQLLGDVATRIQQGDRFLDVRVRYPDARRVDPTVEGERDLRCSCARTSKLVSLSSLAEFRRTVAENELERENQTPMVRVTARWRGGTSAPRAGRSSAPCSG